jgi:hypothetical protein
MAKPRIEIVFRRGRPVAAFFHLREGTSGKSGRTIAIRPQMTAHYDDAGHPTGLELSLPTRASALEVNDALRELSGDPVEDADLVPLRMA